MKKTYYKKSVMHLWKGHSQLVLSAWNTIVNYPAWALLAVSVAWNIMLFYSQAEARMQRDKLSYEAMRAEQKADSLKMLMPPFMR